jgi:hypothetical protein
VYQRLSGASRDAQVDGVVAALLGGSASPETREVLRSGNHPMLDGAAAPTRAPVLTGFAQIVGLALGSPEFQRR